MISSKDFEKLWFLYQTDGAPNGISINKFCIQRGVPYNEFDKWYRKTHRSIAPVEVIGVPGVEQAHDSIEFESDVHSQSKPELLKGNILVTIKTRNGLQVSKSGLDYEGLKLLVERLEGLC